MQIFLGSLYVNDFNKFGRTYQVIAQADAPFRSTAEDIKLLKVRNARRRDGAARCHRADPRDVRPRPGRSATTPIPPPTSTAVAAPGVSSGEARAIMENILKETLPNGFGYEWTELTYQEILAGNTAVFIFPLCVLLAFLVLAAQYESWSMPLAVILIVPMCILCALTGVWLTEGRQQRLHPGRPRRAGRPRLQERHPDRGVRARGAAEGRHRRRRRARGLPAPAPPDPDDVVRLHHGRGAARHLAAGAGSEMRHAMGVAVFSGMLGVTFFGLILTPVFYVTIQKLVERRKKIADPAIVVPAREGDAHA